MPTSEKGKNEDTVFLHDINNIFHEHSNCFNDDVADKTDTHLN